MEPPKVGDDILLAAHVTRSDGETFTVLIAGYSVPVTIEVRYADWLRDERAVE